MATKGAKLEAYSKWTARIAIIIIIPGILFSAALIPIHTGDGQRVWPLPHRFGARHAIADGEMIILWIIITGLTLIYIVVGCYLLLRRAKWVK